MVHLCNIKMLAILVSHKPKVRQYDIDGFISQLLAARKFDDLAEKLAEKAANKIIQKVAAPAPIKRATDDNEADKRPANTQGLNQNHSNGEYVNKFEKNQMDNVKLRKDFIGKINPQAIINATISLSQNLQLKYKYLKKNALEKRVKSNRDPLPKNGTEEDPSKHNKTTGPTDFIDRNNKTEELISNQNATGKNETKKESIDENKRTRDDTNDGDWKEHPNRNSELYKSSHTGKGAKTNDSRKKPDHSLEKLSAGNELTIFREAQNSGPEDKGIVEQEASQVNDGKRDDKSSSLDEENQKHLRHPEENNNEEVVKIEGDPVKRGSGKINEDENVILQFRAREDSVKDNEVTSDYNPHVGDYNPHVGVYKTRVSDDRSKEQSPENRMSEEESSEDQSSKDQSGEDPNSSKLKPVIRKEGNQLYTYVRDPEYADYHEKLAKWQKRHPQNPADVLK